MTSISPFFLFTVWFGFGLISAWQNNWDGPLNFACESNEYINRLESQHHNRHEDRLWQYYCASLPYRTSLGKCTWFNNVNVFDQLLAFRCRGTQAITGVDSRHENKQEDRVFGFRCCEISGRKLDGCYFTDFINSYDRYMNYRLPYNHVITGMISVHDNHREWVWLTKVSNHFSISAFKKKKTPRLWVKFSCFFFSVATASLKTLRMAVGFIRALSGLLPL